MRHTKTEQLLKLAAQIGILRPRDLDTYGIPRHYLHRLYQRGLLEQVDRGLYRAKETALSEHHSLLEASKRVPQGVICLLSALRFHGLTTQEPFEVWLAIPEKARRPQPGILSIRLVHFSGQALTEGIEEHEIEGVEIKIYNAAKTVADCFKYRHKIGLDVALEALRDALRLRNEQGQRLCTIDELWHYATICRVANVMKPYLEALVVD